MSRAGPGQAVPARGLATRGERGRRAPWYVIPDDHKWVTRAVVADVVTAAIRSLDLKYPEVTDEQLEGLAEAKRRLLAE